MPVGDVMNSGDNGHINNGTVTSNGSRSSSCHIRALQGVTGCSVAQQSMDGRSRKQQGSAGRSMTLQGIAELSRECSRTTATAATRVLVQTFSKEIRWGKKHKDSGE